MRAWCPASERWRRTGEKADKQITEREGGVCRGGTRQKAAFVRGLNAASCPRLRRGRGPGPSRSLVRAVWSQPRSPVGGTEVTVGLPASRPSKARDAGALLSETPDAHV